MLDSVAGQVFHPIRQCLDVTLIPGDGYRISARTYLTAGEAARGEIYLDLLWRDAPNCGGSEIGPRLSTGKSSVELAWQPLYAIGEVPQGAVSASALVWFVGKTSDGFMGCVDEVRVVLLPEPSLALQQAAALAGLGVLARAVRRRAKPPRRSVL